MRSDSGASADPGPTTRGGVLPGGARDARYASILDVATQLFYEKGFSDTSIKDISEAVGLLKGSLYYYMDSKEDLFYKIVSRNLEDALANHEELDELNEPDPTKALESFVRAHVAYHARNPQNAAIFYRDGRHLSPAHYREIVARRTGFETRLREMIVRGQEAGAIHAEHDPAIAATALLTMINSMYLWYHRGGRLTVDEIADQLVALTLSGLRV